MKGFNLNCFVAGSTSIKKDISHQALSKGEWPKERRPES
jgi:hypothetical protein